MIKESLQKLAERIDLSRDESRHAMMEIMSGEATDAQIAAFLMGLRQKGETIEEITGCAQIMRDMVTPVHTQHKIYVDNCGTGGDRKGTFNISTCAAFIVAAAGVPVAKHGNRSVSSLCGSADVLSALGAKIDCSVAISERCLNELNFCFLFAPLYHRSTRYAAPARQQMGIRTVFNIIGPMTNPALAPCYMMGVFNPEMPPMIAQVLLNLGVHRALVVHGVDGLDEITLAGDTKVAELCNGKIKEYYIEPRDFGLTTQSLNTIVGGDALRNAELFREVLNGKSGPHRDIVLMNAAAAILAGDGAINLQEAFNKAAQAVDSGSAIRLLNEFITLSNSTGDLQ